MNEQIVIGRKDKVDFPDLQIFGIDVKIDTGAYTSSIHCQNIEIIRDGGAQAKVRFNLLDPTHPDYNEKEFIHPVTRVKYVKSSSGESEKRIFIKTVIVMFGEHFVIELSLTNRSDMKYPVLLGRRLLKRGFLVDVTKINLSYRMKRRASKKLQEPK